MREIMSPEERAVKEAKQRRIIVIIISVVLILSTLGYSLRGFGGGSKNKIKYKDVTFGLQEDGWHFALSGIDFVTTYNPLETENVSAPIFMTANDYAGKPLYYSDDSSVEGMREIAQNLDKIISRMQPTCMTVNCTEFVRKNCTSSNIIIIRQTNETFINQKENCISIYASPGEMIRASDKFLFKILGLQ